MWAPVLSGGRAAFLLRAGASYGVHLGGDLVEEGHAVFAVYIKIKVGAVGDVGEVGVGVETLENGFVLVRGTIEIEGVGGADDEVDAAFEVGSALRPRGLSAVREVVVVAPIGYDLGMDGAGGAIEHFFRRAAGAFRRKDPVEGRELAAVGAEDFFQPGKLLEG